MSVVRFSDGVEFEASGEPRVERRPDGLYVVGDGIVLPVDSDEEAQEEIERLLRERAAK